MIHLFNKCYLELDNKIDIHTNRYVISKENGVDMWDKLKNIQRGVLYGYQSDIETSEVVSTVASIYFKLKDPNEKIVFYLDEESFLKFLPAWYKFLLPNLDEIEAANIYRAIALYHNVYHRFIFQDFNNVDEYALSDNPKDFLNHWDSIKDIQYSDAEKYFRELILSNTSFEFKLPTFLYNGSMFEELEKVTRMFLKKEVEISFVQMREIFFSQFLDPRWSGLVGMNKSYTLENAHDVKNDGSAITDFLFSDRIWNTSSLAVPSTKTEMVNIDNISREDIHVIVEFLITLKLFYSSLKDYQEGVPLDLSRYPLITVPFYVIEYLENIQKGFTAEELRSFILKDNSYLSTDSIFNGSILPTVNSYIIRHIIANMDNKEFLKKYSLNKI